MENEKDLCTLRTKKLGVFDNVSTYWLGSYFFYVVFDNGGKMCIPKEQVISLISNKSNENKKPVIHQDLFDFHADID